MPNDTIEALKAARNIYLDPPKPVSLMDLDDDSFMTELDRLMAEIENSGLNEDYEEFLQRPDLQERQNQAECIILQLKEFYRAKGWNVYEHENRVRILLHKPAHPYTTEVWTDAEQGLLHLKIQIPVLVSREMDLNFMARALHNFNQEAEAGAGFFTLDDGIGRVDYICRYSFEDEAFTEEKFHCILNTAMKAVSLYYTAILSLAK